MAHEIEKYDGLVLHREKAWHGLGTIVENAPTPREALKIAGLDWDVEQWVLSATDGEGQRQAISSHVVNLRKLPSGGYHQLGVVGKGWTPFQNSELADFCEALSADGTVTCESAGSIRNGERVWFLLKGEAFGVRDTEDAIVPYILCSNGFDGGTSLRVTPTTVRVVCSNTLHAVIPRSEKGGGKVPGAVAAYVCRHTGSLKERVKEAQNALKTYAQRIEEQKTFIDQLAARDVNHEGVNRFFLECFTKHFGAVADDAKSDTQKRKREQAMDCVRACVANFEAEEGIAGATAWNAMNAYTKWLQHGRKVRRRDASEAADLRLSSNLFGDNATRSVEAFRLAFSLGA